MKLQDQVCTLDQSKRLNDLGVVQGASAFYHNTNSGAIEYNSHRKTGTFYNAEYCFSAFTVAELGVMLPHTFQYAGENCFVCSEKYTEAASHAWIAGIHTVWAYNKPILAKKYFPGPTEAQVRAALLIYLLENKYITAEEVNKRLQQ